MESLGITGRSRSGAPAISIVLDLEFGPGSANAESHPEPGGVGVASRVGEQLLKTAKQLQARARGQDPISELDLAHQTPTCTMGDPTALRQHRSL
ncbi:MAG: hypothetical protein AAF627_10460 [Myxococcota bacterium]